MAKGKASGTAPAADKPRGKAKPAGAGAGAKPAVPAAPSGDKAAKPKAVKGMDGKANSAKANSAKAKGAKPKAAKAAALKTAAAKSGKGKGKGKTGTKTNPRAAPNDRGFEELPRPPASFTAPPARPAKLSSKVYAAELARLHAELVKLQDWVVHKQLKICVVFEGRDTAGKGGTIKAITERVSPRVFRVVALPKPNDRERSQMYLQRYIKHLPAGGEIVLFDRSWYNRAGVERVMGFCTDEQAKKFLAQAPGMERAITDSGIILIKYWLEVSAEEQTRRLQARIDDPRKTWKLSPMDLESYRQWYAYSRARDEMFRATDTSWAPWFVAFSDDKKAARLNIIKHLLAQVPYKAVPGGKVKLPKRKHDKHYVEPDYPYRMVPEQSWGSEG